MNIDESVSKAGVLDEGSLQMVKTPGSEKVEGMRTKRKRRKRRKRRNGRGV